MERYYTQCRKLVTQYQIEDNIKFKGFCDLINEFAKDDALLIKSYSEGLPQVNLDAFASELTVVAYDVGAARKC